MILNGVKSTELKALMNRNISSVDIKKKEECIEEERPIFTQNEVRGEYKYLFDSIIPVNELKECDTINMNEWIKNELNEKQEYIYEIQKYIQLPSEKEINLHNPERQKMKKHEEYEYLKRKNKANIESEIQRVANQRRR
ncbi:hypothetical protein ENUP19_0021G0032 [Entamoeba nuttalli]|uniref:Uncharacterized protein n=1 Tax=Entamoeba nuttalli TaxID=412467 RepID=A0ABQ0D946_9EUKA